MLDKGRAAQLHEQVAQEFDQMESTLKNQQPGLLELVNVFGGYQATVAQAEGYLRILQPQVKFSTTDRSPCR